MQTFTKAERLSSKIKITALFENGKSFNSPPLKVIWQETNDLSAPVQIVISVPKRSFKRAVDRNRLKRLIREVYRKNKENLYAGLNNKKVHVLFIFTGKIMMDYREIEEKTIIALERLKKSINS